MSHVNPKPIGARSADHADCVASRGNMIHELAERIIGELDTVALMNASLETGQDLDAVVASLERRERARLRKLKTPKLWALYESE